MARERARERRPALQHRRVTRDGQIGQRWGYIGEPPGRLARRSVLPGCAHEVRGRVDPDDGPERGDERHVLVRRGLRRERRARATVPRRSVPGRDPVLLLHRARVAGRNQGGPRTQRQLHHRPVARAGSRDTRGRGRLERRVELQGWRSSQAPRRVGHERRGRRLVPVGPGPSDARGRAGGGVGMRPPVARVPRRDHVRRRAGRYEAA